MSEPVRRNTKKNLPAAKKRAKKRRERQNLDWAVQPLSYKDARQQVKADTRLRFGQVTDELKQRPQQIGNWFGQYQAQLKGIQQGVQQGYNQAIKEVDQRAAATQQSGQPIGNVDQSVLQQAGQAGMVRRQGNDAFANLLTAQRQTQDSYFGARSDIGDRQRVQELLDTGRMREALKRDKGAFKATRLNELKEDERRYGLERKAFGLNVAKLRADVLNERADRKQENREKRRDRRQENSEVNQWGYAKKDWQAMTPAQRQQIMARVRAEGRAPSGGGGDDGLTPYQRRQARKERRKTWSRVEDVRQAYRSYRKMKDENGNSPTPAQVRARILDEFGTGAADLLTVAGAPLHKPWSKAQIAAAKRLGIKVPKTNRPQPYTPSGPGSDAAQG